MHFLQRLKKFKLIATEIASNPNILMTRSRYLFILSHMRSRSSVLSHLLGSNIDICGYSELHKSYLRYSDILLLKTGLQKSLGCDLNGKYLLDKLLHNKYCVSSDVLRSVSPKIIILLREPEATIQSIIKMKQNSSDLSFDPAIAAVHAVKYYCERLKYLSEFAANLRQDFFLLDSSDLIDNTSQSLARITEWLGLDFSLVSEYMLFNNTGKPGFGDPSENIMSGRLFRTIVTSEFEISGKLLSKSRLAFEDCMSTLSAKSFRL